MLKGLLDPCLLAVIAVQDAYGYEVVRRLGDAGLADVADGSIYPALTRLERAGLVQAKRVPSPSGPPRKYFQLTSAGLAHLEAWREEWEALQKAVTAVFAKTRRSEKEQHP